MLLLRQVWHPPRQTMLNLGCRRRLGLEVCRQGPNYSTQAFVSSAEGSAVESTSGDETVTCPVTPPPLAAVHLINKGTQIPGRPSAAREHGHREKSYHMYTFKLGQWPLLYMYKLPIQPRLSSRKSTIQGKGQSQVRSLLEKSDRNHASDGYSSTPTARLSVSPESFDNVGHPMHSVATLERCLRKTHSRLTTLLHKIPKDAPPEQVPLDQIVELYSQLPGNRVCYLQRTEVSKILFLLAQQNNRINSVARHTMTVIWNMRDNQTVIRLSEWTQLIDAIGKAFVYEKEKGMQHILKCLDGMSRTGIQADVATLTSIYHSALRCKNWAVTEFIDNEMRKRNLDDNIIVWTMRIKAAGKRSPRAIHNTFREFCERGIPVDINFVNALLEAFLNTKQATLAELIYMRLRRFAEIGPQDVKRIFSRLQVRKKRRKAMSPELVRALSQGHLEMELAKRRIDPNDRLDENGLTALDALRMADGNIPRSEKIIMPTFGTIRLFISYHCHYTGRLGDVAFYINDMERFGVPLQYGTYADILHGFFLWHRPNGEWTTKRLERVFAPIREGVMAGKPPFRITYIIALTAIRAFGKLHYGGRKAREVWELLRPWIKINENVQDGKDSRLFQLEQLVRKFENCEDLGAEMSGGDKRWRVLDWRTY